MRRLVSSGESVPLVLRSDLGDIQIAGRTHLCTFDSHLFEMSDTSVLQQGIVRYQWDGESTMGLMERSTLSNELQNTGDYT